MCVIGLLLLSQTRHRFAWISCECTKETGIERVAGLPSCPQTEMSSLIKHFHLSASKWGACLLYAGSLSKSKWPQGKAFGFNALEEPSLVDRMDARGNCFLSLPCKLDRIESCFYLKGCGGCLCSLSNKNDFKNPTSVANIYFSPLRRGKVEAAMCSPQGATEVQHL